MDSVTFESLVNVDENAQFFGELSNEEFNELVFSLTTLSSSLAASFFSTLSLAFSTFPTAFSLAFFAAATFSFFSAA